MLWKKLNSWLHNTILMLPNFLLAALVVVVAVFVVRAAAKLISKLLRRFSLRAFCFIPRPGLVSK